MKRILLLAVLVMLVALSLTAAPNPVTTVILVRHGEKTSPDADELSADGQKRAQELARVLAGLKLDAIYTTQFQRTKDTAKPTATALQITPAVRETGANYPKDLAAHIRAAHVGQTVLVVGHSNTTVDVMRAFGAVDLPTIPESQFDNLFVLTDVAGAAPKVVALRYGVEAR
jgi:broad specificity phosphatase PhoE